LAKRIGAANTLIFDPADAGAAARAINTDYAGALGALVSGIGWRREELAGRRCAVLGAGGAARAVVAGLADCGCQVTVYNRTEARAKALAAEFGCRWRPFEQRDRLDAEVVVNTTSVGMHPNVDESPLADSVLREGMVVFETIYNPLETLLVKQAERAGCQVVDGAGMFVEQAALQFEAWTGRSAPRELMRQAVVARLAEG
jgi:3-dehydroquinate dehydratase/shikimate dehydrogenase